jgi:poly-gamma-glutamate synthesis protein (capsule biosynthesis protein)
MHHVSKIVSTVAAILILFLTGYNVVAWTSPARLSPTPAALDKSFEDFYEQGRNLTLNQDPTVTFLAVGDISLSRNVAATIDAKGDTLYPFRGMHELLNSTDFNFGNLETPFSSSDRYTAKNTLVFNAPKKNVAGLKEYNFAVLNLANNHAFDQGLDGVRTTRNILRENGLAFMGVGENLDEAWEPAIVEKNGIRIGFLGASYTSLNDGGKATNPHVARMEDVARLKAQITSLKSTVDFIVVTMHAGTEYTRTPNQGQVTFAHAAVDAGADIVIGAHPHWVQTTEQYNGKPIYYSLGNFIFDQDWSPETQQGLALKITLSKKAGANSLQGPEVFATLENIEEIPIHIKENCCAYPAAP